MILNSFCSVSGKYFEFLAPMSQISSAHNINFLHTLIWYLTKKVITFTTFVGLGELH
jgi:hypothetical protein